MTFWQTLGNYEYEVKRTKGGGCRYTGWCRSVGGRMADGRWPERNNKTGQVRYG